MKFAKLGAAFLGEVAKGATTGNTPPPTGGGGGGGTVNTATFDATLKAPRCTAAGAGCDSGTLLNGRGSGPGGEQAQHPQRHVRGRHLGHLPLRRVQ